MLSRSTRRRIWNNRLRRQAWRTRRRREEDQAIIRMIRSRVGVFIATHQAWTIASVSNSYVPAPNEIPAYNPFHFGSMAYKPELVSVLSDAHTRKLYIMPSYLHVTDELILTCQRIRREVRQSRGV